MTALQLAIYNKYMTLLDALSLGVLLPYSILQNACMFEKSQINNDSLKEFFINKLK